MYKRDLFDKTISIIENAYRKSILSLSVPGQCLVGVLVAGNLGYKHISSVWLDENGKLVAPSWEEVFCTSFGKQVITKVNYQRQAKEEIDSTGYTWQELAKMEYAFERQNSERRGVLLVIDILAEIHQLPEEVTLQAKKLFS